jgi:membrane-bound serine protease (ClpP class)
VKAEKDGSEALLILMDTPGGLDTSMRDIVKGIMESNIPVIVYVYPSGARAASAGSVILLASHVAAMAPGTNAGAAHPVSWPGKS